MKGDEYVFGQSIKLKLMESHLDGEGMRGSGFTLYETCHRQLGLEIGIGIY
jgi:hypothetical protein